MRVAEPSGPITVGGQAARRVAGVTGFGCQALTVSAPTFHREGLGTRGALRSLAVVSADLKCVKIRAAANPSQSCKASESSQGVCCLPSKLPLY